MDQRKSIWLDLSLVLGAFIWGLNFSVVKFTLGYITPFTFNALRYLLGASIMWMVCWHRGEKIKIQKGDLIPLILLSLMGQFLYQVLFIIGINITLAANAAVMLGTNPIWVAILAHFFFDEKLTPAKLIGVMMAFTGMVFVILGGGSSLGIDLHTLSGDLILITGAAIFGLYALLSRRFLQRYSPLQMNTLMLSFGGTALFIAGIPSLLHTDFTAVPLAAYGGILYNGSLSIGVAYILWNNGLQKLGAIHTANYQNLVPVFGLILSVLLLNEKLFLAEYVGAALTITGIVITRRARKKVTAVNP